MQLLQAKPSFCIILLENAKISVKDKHMRTPARLTNDSLNTHQSLASKSLIRAQTHIPKYVTHKTLYEVPFFSDNITTKKKMKRNNIYKKHFDKYTKTNYRAHTRVAHTLRVFCGNRKCVIWWKHFMCGWLRTRTYICFVQYNCRYNNVDERQQQWASSTRKFIANKKEKKRKNCWDIFSVRDLRCAADI